MRIARVRCADEVFYAILREDGRFVRLAGDPFTETAPDGRSYDFADVTLLAPCTPSKIVCVGKNYQDHADEMKEGAPAEPLLFIKPNTCVVGPEADVCYPACSERVDYEAELGVVMGRRAHAIAPGTAHEYILGYTCLNDVTARDIQKKEGQWTRGKSFDTFCPIGPWIETELDAQHVGLCSRLNGVVKQQSNTARMIHSIDRLLCVMSACMTLLPGDVIATGTPAGIGPMRRGDVIEIEVDGIGVLRNRVV